MQKLLVTLAAIFFFTSCGEGGCDFFKDTRVSNPKTYTETGGKTKPYFEVEKKPWFRKMDCGATGCNYSVWIWVKLYNPTTTQVLAETTCTFTVGENFTSGVAKRKGIKVPPGKMVKVDVSHIIGLSVEEPTTAGVECEATFN